MSELKVASCFEFEKVLQGKSNKLFYPKSEADKVIAELEAKNRRLERALYKACANWAKEFRYKIGFAISSMNTKYDYSDADKWQNVEHKCRAKAEEWQ